jgi:hypothetical protein
MAEYQLTATDQAVIRTADSAFIPNDPANRDWVEYQDWLAAGGVPDPYAPPLDPPPAPPDPNARLNDGVRSAMQTYDKLTSAKADELSVEERLVRLEETIKAMCDGHMTYSNKAD